eukprot:gene30926-26957_t
MVTELHPPFTVPLQATQENAEWGWLHCDCERAQGPPSLRACLRLRVAGLRGVADGEQVLLLVSRVAANGGRQPALKTPPAPPGARVTTSTALVTSPSRASPAIACRVGVYAYGAPRSSGPDGGVRWPALRCRAGHLTLGDTSRRLAGGPTVLPLAAAKGAEVGSIVCDEALLRDAPLFVDYFRGGFEIRVELALDFTSSNGHPSSATSLHSTESAANHGRIGVHGFGARLWAMFCGINGALGAYESTVQDVWFSGPTHFAPAINIVADACRKGASGRYTILIIVTDGACNDMHDTVEAVVAASELPLSIVIVGALDSDEELLLAPSGRRAVRDIVQFVRFLDFVGRPTADLAREVLDEPAPERRRKEAF